MSFAGGVFSLMRQTLWRALDGPVSFSWTTPQHQAASPEDFTGMKQCIAHLEQASQ